jgi:hypothetical protein
MAIYHHLTISSYTEFSLPDKFKTWDEATEAVMEARAANKTPEEVDPEIWKVFETVAFELIPAING